jgi:hypothetical protein
MENNYLEQLVDLGYAEKTVKTLKDKVTIKLRTLGGEDQLAIESEMSTLQGNALFVVHTYSIKLLSYVLKEYITDKEKYVFLSNKEAEVFLRPKASVIIDALVKEHELFTKELKEITTVEKIDENFTTTPPTVSA